MKPSHLIVHLLLVMMSATAVAQELADPILLWPAGAPGATGNTDEDKPAIIPFIPDAAKRNGAAILVVPGGGFTIRAVDHEGVLVAQWLKEQGITAFLLRYRLHPLYGRKDWLSDGQRGLQYIRSHAAEYQLSMNRIGAVGFSAGANLIADMAFHPLAGKPGTKDPLNGFSSRPDFIILAYGSMKMPDDLDSLAVANLPPTFMYGTSEDAGSMRGLADLYTRLFYAKVPVEAHFFRNGEHGSGFAIGDPILGEWPHLMHTWLKAGGFLTSKPQLPVSGVVKLDGKPLLRGMLILTPIGSADAPPVVAYITNTGTGELGRFSVPGNQGPIAGPYRVEVRQEATRWTSNSRDPFMIGMMTKQRENTLTDDDIKEWGEYLRKRDLSPSIDHQRVFSRQRPGDAHDYQIEIKDGRELLISVFSH